MPGRPRELLAATVEAAAGRVPVIAGIIVDSTREAIQRGRLAQDLGVAALQVTPVHYLFRPDDDAMVEHFRAVTAETGLPVIIYNVVPWTYLSPALLVRIMTEVPAVIGVKQSAGDLKLLADLMVTAAAGQADLQRGRCAALPVVHARRPWRDRRDPDGGAGPLRRAVGCGRGRRPWPRPRPPSPPAGAYGTRCVADNLPACTRFAQACQGVAAGASRAPMPAASPAQRRAIAAALEGLGITVQPVGRAA